jgi:minor extracellular serine protease Vpr
MRPITHFILAIFALSIAAYAQPSVAAGGVLNGASFATGQPVAPGSLVSIFGTGLASTNSAATTVPLSTQLSNVQVTFNNIAAPLNFVSSGQINAQLPFELTGQSTAQVVVTNNGVASAAQSLQVASIAPGIFALTGGQAVAYGNTSYLFAAPAGSIPGLTTQPAKILDPQTLVILATGLGPVTPPLADGVGDPTTIHTTPTNPTVLVGNVAAQVVFSGILPGFPGVYQINIIIQAGTPTGNAVPLQIQMGGITTSSSTTIAVSN